MSTIELNPVTGLETLTPGMPVTLPDPPEEAVDLGEIIPEEGIDLRAMLALIEKVTIQEALSKSTSIAGAARLLRISRPSLDYKLKIHGLSLEGRSES